jgi:hypothetical protein
MPKQVACQVVGFLQAIDSVGDCIAVVKCPAPLVQHPMTALVSI